MLTVDVEGRFLYLATVSRPSARDGQQLEQATKTAQSWAHLSAELPKRPTWLAICGLAAGTGADGLGAATGAFGVRLVPSTQNALAGD